MPESPQSQMKDKKGFPIISRRCKELPKTYDSPSTEVK